MMSSTSEIMCDSAPFALNVDDRELYDILDDVEYSDISQKWIPRPDQPTCGLVPEYYSRLLVEDKKVLKRIFGGSLFVNDLELISHSLVVCEFNPNIVMIPKNSIFGNRLFLCSMDSDWFKFLFPYCVLIGKDNSSIDNVYIKPIGIIPSEILERFKPRAQGLIDFSLLKVDLSQFVDSIFSNLETFVSSKFMGDVNCSFKMIGVILQLVSVCESPSVLSLSSLFYNLLVTCSIPFKMVKTTLEFISPYLTVLKDAVFGTIPVKAQVLDDNSSIISSLATVVVTIVSVVTMSKLPDKSTIMSCINFTAKIGRSLQGLTSILDFMSKHIMAIFDWCYERFTGLPRTPSSLDSFSAEVKSFILTVSDYLQRASDENYLRDDVLFRARIRELYCQGVNIRKRLVNLKVDISELNSFMAHWRSLEKLMERANIYGGTNGGPRSEPLVVQLVGASGVGKSHLMYYIALEVMDEEQIKLEDAMSEIYLRNIEQQYWDGYRGQTVVIYDDFGQRSDTSSSPNLEFMEIIRSGNVAEWPLHMAALQEKNSTFFKSKCCILTSNEVKYNIPSLTHPEAFERRIDIRLKAYVKAQFKDHAGKIDVRKVMSTFGTTMSKYIYEFELIERTGSGSTSHFYPVPNAAFPDRYDYDQIADYIRLKYKQKRTHSSVRIDALNEYARELTERRSFKDASANTPKAQVDLSAADELLMCWYYSEGFPTTLFEDNVDEIDKMTIEQMKLDSPDVWHFVSSVIEGSIPLTPRVLDRNKVDAIYEDVVNDRTDEHEFKQHFVADQTWLSSLKGKMEKFKQSKLFTILATLGSFIAGSLLIYKLYKTFFGEAKDPCTYIFKSAEGNVSGDNVTQAKPVIKVEGNVSGDQVTMSKPTVKVESQAYIDTNAQEVIQNSIVSNLYRIGGVNSSLSANIVFVKGRIALSNWHVVDFISQHDQIRIVSLDLSEGYTVPFRDIVIDRVIGADGEPKDACLLTFPNFVHTHRDITKHFVTAEDISKFNTQKGLLVGLVPARKHLCMRIEPLEKILANDNLNYEYKDASRKTHTMMIRKCYRYASHTAAGDCGSLLFVNDPRIPRKICAIHTAGTTGNGFATSITKTDLERTTANCEMGADLTFDLPSEIISTPRAQLENELPTGDFVVLGESPKPVGSPTKTDIRPSPIHGMVTEPRHAPSALKPVLVNGELVDPLKKGLAKCGKPCKYIDQETLQAAVDSFRPVLFENSNAELKKVLSYEQAITGTEHVFVKPINRRSSAGYGWSDKTEGKIGKTKWFGDGEYILDNAEIKSAVMERIEAASAGKRYPHLWADTLKVERREIEKVQQGKTRVFSVGQMDYILAARMYFLGFNAHVMDNRISNEIAVGICPYSHEWTTLANHLQKKGKHVIAGDFSNYDGSLNPQILHACLDLINEWYDDGDENRRIRQTLFDEVVSSVHICGKLVYQWTHSQPSGNALTTILNSLYNSISMRIVYMLVMGEVFTFNKNVSMISYGDDNVVNIRSTILDSFNQNTISEAYALIGMTYTDESKGKNEVIPFRTLDRVEFLKRGFILRNGNYDAPLTLDTVLEMVNWVRGDFDHDDLCKTNLETAFEELSFHDEQVFVLWTKKMMAAARSVNIHPTLYSYKQMRLLIRLRAQGTTPFCQEGSDL